MLVTISENTAIDNNYIESLNIDTQLFKCKSISELQEKMMFIIDKLDKYIEEKKEINYNDLLQNIINFIDINISNVDLSVSMIADNFNISIVNLSKFFKKNTGIGMLDYINKLRIEKAKMIIKVEDLSIKEIGERVGYYNSAAFIRVFKKYEGITPGKHKEAF
jgi:YesN/AraC family two-component response regulator